MHSLKVNSLKKLKTIIFLFFPVFLLITGCITDNYRDADTLKYTFEQRDVALDSLKLLARELVEKVKDDPHGRYQLRKEFYKKFGHGKFSEFGFGNSELAFLRWEERGLLNPSDSTPSGSPWWRAVNLEFIYWSELAGMIFTSELNSKDSIVVAQPVQFWLEYLEKPSSKTWYRAHNSSIISGYTMFVDLAREEIHAEQVFINMVLYRLLYAQAMVEKEHFTFGKLGKWLSNPSGFAVDFIVNDPFFYPATYPLTEKEIDNILGNSHTIGELEVKFLDNVLILPHLDELYSAAAQINLVPELLHFIKNGQPVYPFLDNP